MAETFMYFFSNHCKYCMNLTSEINNNKFSNINIFPVCIDSADMKKKVPKSITKVPAIMNSKTKEVFIGNKAFVFIRSIGKSQGNQAPGGGRRSGGPNGPNPNASSAPSSSMGSPSPWTMNEMGKTYSDQYSFLDSDTSAKGNGGFSHAFAFINSGPIPIQTPKNDDSRNNSNEIDNLIAQRDRDIPMPKGRVG